MKKHHLSVTTLEEHEPNREFIGRNFNNGEIIQLVLKNRGGGWMPFRHVQMVMMHELAHNVQMNHKKLFWVERNKFAADLKELWAKNYTGDGFWGRGRTTDLQTIEANAVMPTDDLAPAALCGGTYRSRRRKRKRGGNTTGGQELTWKEKRDSRIEKKFGKNGVRLGEDDTARMMLEINNKNMGAGRPRVANSKRGRELRAAAALARFNEQPKQEEQERSNPKDEDEETEYESDDDDDDDDLSSRNEDARDTNGQRLLDNMGFRMVKVCEDEEADDTYVKQEMAELEALVAQQLKDKRTHQKKSINPLSNASPATPERNQTTAPKQPNRSLYDIPQHPRSPSPSPTPTSLTPSSKPFDPQSFPLSKSCPMCTLNLPTTLTLTCPSCSHLLHPYSDPNHWVCSRCYPSSSSSSPLPATTTQPQKKNNMPDDMTTTTAARESSPETKYINSGDTQMCGICGERRKDDERRNEKRERYME
ncbi:putative wlm domain-containing protein [Phaeomoniella chlamydospora]|uniref:Putative wlm domain-containing protein n=1 Tax=Phaeomoniella chlamydospora TaxID=158046 RepID=A0A0G2ECV8_PHACM|nr:putative wlm domain-containing protein [Phaeomoniella chlamydospora]